MRILLYLTRRIATASLTLLIVAVLVFALIRSIPADPVVVMFGEAADPAQMQALRQRLGLDRPLPLQFGEWLLRAAGGDFGASIRNGEPVLDLMLDRLEVSVEVIFAAMLIAALIAVPLGTIAAWRRGSGGDLAIVTSATLLLSIPSFWLGLLLLLVFGVKLDWLPVVGYAAVDAEASTLAFLILPVATLVLIEIGVITRMARANALDVLRLEYVTHARAKGLAERTVLWRHVLPNSFAPTLTLIGLITGQLLGGLAVIETVFALPGFGRLLVESIFARDYPVIQGCMLVTALFFALINLAVDLLYPLLDPRVAAR